MIFGNPLAQAPDSGAFFDAIVELIAHGPLSASQQNAAAHIANRVMARYNAGVKPAFTPSDFRALYAAVGPRPAWSPAKL